VELSLEVATLLPPGRSMTEEKPRTVEVLEFEPDFIGLPFRVLGFVSAVEDDKSAVTVVNELVDELVEEVGVVGSCSSLCISLLDFVEDTAFASVFISS
jgi:hypothetical protein